MNHYINDNIEDLALARTVSILNPRQSRSFPVLAYGDNIQHFIYVHNDGTIEPWSGQVANKLRVTIGALNLGPASGNYTLTVAGSPANPTPALDSQSTAAELTTALNGLANVQAAGGLTVTGTFPNFLIAWSVPSAATPAITAAAGNLVPPSVITLTSIVSGSGTQTQQVALTLQQNPIVQQATWATVISPYAGWSGYLATTSAATLAQILEYGAQVGEYFQLETVITIEYLDPSGNYLTLYQAPCIIRAKPGILA